jgi:hypothetical protein
MILNNVSIAQPRLTKKNSAFNIVQKNVSWCNVSQAEMLEAEIKV